MNAHAGAEERRPREIGPEEVLGVYDAGAGTLRGNHSKDEMLLRLGLLSKLVPAARWPGAAPWGMTREAAAVVSFLARSQQWPDAYRWAKDAVRIAGMDPLLLLAAAGDAGGAVGSPYVRPMASFRGSPAYYQLVPLRDLPYGPSMYCPSSPELRRLIAARRRTARLRNFLRRLDGAQDRAAMQAAGRDFQLRLDAGRVAPCHRHVLTDWDAAARDAERIRTRVRPWTSTDVWAACSPTGGEDLTPHVVLLRNLFLDPVSWKPGPNNELSSGQHRVCQARTAGADTIMVAIGP